MKNINQLKFTLIELMVVLSILLILTSALIVALNNVKTEIRRIECSNNLNNIGNASLSFWAENTRIYTPTGNLANRNFGTGMLMKLSQASYLNIKRPSDGTNTYYDNTNIGSGGDIYFHSGAMIFTCPEQELYRMSVSRNYGYNSYLQNPEKYYPFKGYLARVTNPSKTLHWMDTDGAHTLGYNEFFGSRRRTIINGNRHNQLSNIAFLDGHIEPMEPEPYVSGLAMGNW